MPSAASEGCRAVWLENVRVEPEGRRSRGRGPLGQLPLLPDLRPHILRLPGGETRPGGHASPAADLPWIAQVCLAGDGFEREATVDQPAFVASDESGFLALFLWMLPGEPGRHREGVGGRATGVSSPLVVALAPAVLQAPAKPAVERALEALAGAELAVLAGNELQAVGDKLLELVLRAERERGHDRAHVGLDVSDVAERERLRQLSFHTARKRSSPSRSHREPRRFLAERRRRCRWRPLMTTSGDLPEGRR